MKDELLVKIKTRGYWRINFVPLGPPKNLTLRQCKDLVNKNSVKLRGWNFPFYHDDIADHYGVANHNKFVSGWIEAGEQKEVWHMYRSGQFLHYASVDEDWMDGSQERQFSTQNIEPGKYLNFVGSLTYYITEIYEFLTRLHKDGLYDQGVKVSVSLNNTRGRELTSFEAWRRLSYPRRTQERNIVFTEKYNGSDLINKPSELAIAAILYFFELFNFDDVSVDAVIREDQKTLYGYKNQQ